MLIRPATPGDDEAIRKIITPIIRAGETYALPSDWTDTEALAYWRSPEHTVFVADAGAVVGPTTSAPINGAAAVMLQIAHS